MYNNYILLSEKDGSKYIGYTTNLKKRFHDHNKGKSKYTAKKRPYRLVWYCNFANKEKAEKFELYLKSSSGRAFISKHIL